MTKKIIFIFSVLFNVIFLFGLLLNYWGSPTYNKGILTKDINVGFLAGDTTIFKIPKGITVRDVSPRGIGAIGQFESNRFEIIITTDRSDLVNYNVPKDSLFQFGNLYSADRMPGVER